MTPRPFVAGLLFGVAVIVRYQNAMLALTAFVVILASRQWRAAARFALGGALAVAMGGALDWVTWGSPFASLVRYVRFHIEKGGWSDEPITYYATTYFHAAGWPIAVVVLGVLLASRRAPGLVALVVTFVVAHSLIAHKETRFLLPIVPLAIALASVGLVVVTDAALRRHRTVSAAILVAFAAAYVPTSAWKLTRATFAALGDSEIGDTSAWHYDESASLLFSSAGQRADLCGLIYAGGSGNDWGHTGTYAYLHNRAPLFHGKDGTFVPYANYIVAPHGRRVPSDYDEIEQSGTFALYRRIGGCVPPIASFSRDSER